MPTVIPVKFRYAARELWFDPRESGAVEGDHVICRTDRGYEIGIATGDARDVSHRQLRATCGEAPLKPVERIATEADLERASMLADRGDAALPTFRRLVGASGLDMKPVGVEWLFDGEKVVCYFSAEERVDFRQLVRDLARELHERIDMRQIGVREEAAVVGGYAHCGQELCCARFGRQFEPVSIRMAKEQDLPLNSTKISGACGRLMCCLRYEFEAYRDFKARAPKRNAVIDTPLGTAKIVEYDTPKEQLTLRLENGKQVRVALADMEASEAAQQKAASLGCACRPDTLTRAALERLQSPDVQMALAELDRTMGTVTDETQGEQSTPTRRRRRQRRSTSGGGAQTDADASTEREAPAAPTTQRRRRRRRGGSSAAGDASAAGSTTQRSGREGESGGAESSRQAADASAPKTRRRRRHHTSATQTSSGQSAASQEAPQAARPRRRPGDRGGLRQTTTSDAAQSPDGTGGRRRRRRSGRRRNTEGSEGGEG